MKSPRWLCFVVFAPLWACGSEAPLPEAPVEPEPPRAEVSDSAGVRMVVTTELPWGSEPLTVDANPLLRLHGEETGGDPFYGVGESLWLPDGTIVLGEAGAKRLRVFNPDGDEVGSFGRSGAGPGEFGGVNDLIASGDTVWVHDSRYARLHRWVWDGTTLDFEGLIDYPKAGELGLPRFVDRFPSGELITEAFQPRSAGKPRGTKAFALHAPDGTFLSRAPDGTPERRGAGLMRPGAASATRQALFQPIGAVGAHADGLIGFDGAGYEVRLWSLDGPLRSVFRLEQATPAFDASMKDRWAEMLRANAAEGMRSTVEEMIANAELPDRLPAFGPLGATDFAPSVVVDDRERVWVRGFRVPGDDRVLWWVVDVEEGFLGSVRLPARFELHAVRGDRVLGVRPDDLDVEHLEVYRIASMP